MEQQVEDLEELFTELSLDQFILSWLFDGGTHCTCVYGAISETGIVVDSRKFFSRIEDGSGREERQAADRRLAERILTDGLPAFIDFWEKYSLVRISEDFVGRKAAGCEE